MKFAYVTNRGLVRAHNEDTLFAEGRLAQEDTGQIAQGEADTGGSAAFLVADGLGGHGHGEVASRFVADAVGRRASEIQDRDSLLRLFVEVDDALREQALRAGDARLMGSTLAGILVRERDILAFNMGDSRIYDLTDGAAQLSIDDRIAPGSNQITQCFGGRWTRELFDPHFRVLPRRLGCKFLLCTDGLTDVVADSEIAALADRPLANLVGGLLDAALAGGAPDNVTIIVVEV